MRAGEGPPIDRQTCLSFLQRSREECTTVDGTDGTDETICSIGLSSPCWILHVQVNMHLSAHHTFHKYTRKYTTTFYLRRSRHR